MGMGKQHWNGAAKMGIGVKKKGQTPHEYYVKNVKKITCVKDTIELAMAFGK